MHYIFHTTVPSIECLKGFLGLVIAAWEAALQEECKGGIVDNEWNELCSKVIWTAGVAGKCCRESSTCHAVHVKENLLSVDELQMHRRAWCSILN